VNEIKLVKKVSSAIIAVLIVSVIGLAWALFIWQGTVTVDISADTSFHVTNADGSSELTTPHTEPVTTTGWHTFTYRIYNDGNTDIEISMSVTDNLPTGATASWDITFPVTISMGGFQPVTLTIGADQAGSGSYSWTLTSGVAP
jgi:hypothetical protein